MIKTISKILILSLFMAMSFLPAQGQTIVSQSFDTDPFQGSTTITTSYPLNTSLTGCQAYSYVVDPAFNTSCDQFPNTTGNGSFLIIDNNHFSSLGAIYTETGLNIPAGNYTLTLRSASRSLFANQNVPLTVQVGQNAPVNFTIPLSGDNWQNTPVIPITVVTGSPSGIFSISQPNGVPQSWDYAIDNIVLTRIPDPCDIPQTTISYSVEDGEYCFTANVGHDPNIASYEYEWLFGDGSIGTGNPSCHTFADGQYNVCVVVYGFPKDSRIPCGQDTFCLDICVVNPEPPCECNIESITSNLSQVGCTAFLDFDATANSCTQIIEMNVDWGDGTSTMIPSIPAFLNHNYTQPGFYFPAITVQGLANDEKCVVVDAPGVVSCGSGFKVVAPGNPGETDGLELFPNPTSGNLQVRHTMEPGSDLELIVTAVDGREVFRKGLTAVESELSLDLSALSSGLYNLELRDQKGKTAHQKFVVE